MTMSGLVENGGVRVPAAELPPPPMEEEEGLGGVVGAVMEEVRAELQAMPDLEAAASTTTRHRNRKLWLRGGGRGGWVPGRPFQFRRANPPLWSDPPSYEGSGVLPPLGLGRGRVVRRMRPLPSNCWNPRPGVFITVHESRNGEERLYFRPNNEE